MVSQLRLDVTGIVSVWCEVSNLYPPPRIARCFLIYFWTLDGFVRCGDAARSVRLLGAQFDLVGMYCTLFIENVYFILVRKKTQTMPARVRKAAVNLGFITMSDVIDLLRIDAAHVCSRNNPYG